MSAKLETLVQTPEQRGRTQEVVRKMAYFNWLEAGRPEQRDLEFWLNAERAWIEHDYVPARDLHKTQPQATNGGPKPELKSTEAGQPRRK